jgi:hypothetical protein
MGAERQGGPKKKRPGRTRALKLTCYTSLDVGITSDLPNGSRVARNFQKKFTAVYFVRVRVTSRSPLSPKKARFEPVRL